MAWHPNLKHRRRSIEERFWEKVDKSGDCWVWTGALGGRGYGYIAKPGGSAANPGAHMIPAHRVSWEIANGQIPDGLLVCHHCDNPRCVRPDHMFLGTDLDNARDRERKGRHRVLVSLPG